MNATTNTKPAKARYVPTRHSNLRRHERTGMFCLWFKFKGNRYQPVLETTDENIALRKRDDKIKEIRNLVENGNKTVTGKMTFNDLLDAYLAHTQTRKDLITGDKIADSSIRSIRDGLNKIRKDKPEWLKREASKISTKDFQDYAKSLGKEKCSASYYNKVIDALKNAYKFGVENFLIAVNPAKDLRRAVQPKGGGGKILTEEQLTETLKHITRPDSRNKWKDLVADLVQFLSLFGTRISTARQILKKDVELEKRKIWVRAEISKNAEEAYWIPICDAAVPLITRMLSYKHPKREEFLLPIGECYKTLHTTWEALKYTVKCPHHVFRHMAATRWIEAGCNLKDVSYWLGHANSVITQEVYQHVRTEASEAEAQKLNRIRGFRFTPEEIEASMETELRKICKTHPVEEKITLNGRAYSQKELAAALEYLKSGGKVLPMTAVA